MKKYWLFFLLSSLFLSGCYTSVHIQPPIKQQRTQITHLLAIDSKGDTVRVQPHDFRLLYNNNPTYYSEWRFYWRNNWITPYSYYRYYYRPYQPIYVYYPYPSWDINTGNKRPEPKVNKPSQPRSSGVTRQEPKRNTQSTPRTTERKRNN